MTQAIGFLGFGEAASQIACGFAAEGTVKLFAYDVALAQTGDCRRRLDERLETAHTAPVATVKELLESASVIMMAIPAKFAKDAALGALSYMTAEHLFCDLTTNRPAAKEALGQAFEQRGALYVDASVMGAVPLYQHKTPTLVSGNGANQMIQRLTPLGMNLTYVGAEAGRAVKIKLTRSVFVKGVEALTLEMLMTARQLGIEEEIISGIEASFQNLGFRKFCGQLVTSGVQHDERRALEAKECQTLEDELGLNSIMMEATFRKLQWYADLGYAKKDPMPICKDFNDLYRLWKETGVIQ